MSEQGASVRRRMLAAAVELIPELGWTGVSTRVLAARPGRSPGSFTTTSRACKHCYAGPPCPRCGRPWPRAWPRSRQAPRPILQSMLGFLDVYSGSDATSLLFIEAALATTRDPDLRQELSRVLDEFRSALAAQLTQDDCPHPRTPSPSSPPHLTG